MAKYVGVLSSPRSGTSLMVRLLVNGFDLTGVGPVFPTSGPRDIYEYRIGAEELKSYGTKEHYVISMLRDPRLVVTSRHSPDAPHTFDFGFWYEMYMQGKALSNQVNVCEVRYEELLTSPSQVQTRLANALELPIVKPFSECAFTSHDASYIRTKDMDAEMGGARPLDTRRIDRWKSTLHRARIKEQLEKFPDMPQTLVELGFETDTSWVSNY